MKKLALLVALAFVVMSVDAQSKMSNFTRRYVSDIQLDTNLQQFSTRALTKSLSRQDLGADFVQAFIHFYDGINVGLLEEFGVIVESEFPNSGIVTCRVPVDKLEPLSRESEIRYVEMATPIERKMDAARQLSAADDVIAGTSPLESPYLGKDVVVGVVDYGFQYNHAAFYNQDKTSLRVKRVWNMNVRGDVPDGYSRGAEYDTEEEIIDAQYDDRSDDSGHATHVAGIAAGADHTDGNPYYGIAQESDLVFVSYYVYDQTNADIANGVKYIFEYADKVDKPAVVNLSLGSHIGPHDGTSTFDRLMDGLVGPGRITVGACGNEGNDLFHLHNDFDSISNDTVMRTFMEFVDAGIYGKRGHLDVWGDSVYSVQVVVYNTRKSYGGEMYLYKSEVYNLDSIMDTNFTVTANAEAEVDGNKENVLRASVKIAVEKNPFNDKYHTDFDFTVYTIPSYGTYLGVEITAKNGTVHMWADNMYMSLNNNRVPGWDKPNSDYGMGEIGGTGKKMVTVGAYVSKNTVDGYEYDEEVGEKTYFSSVGPTADGRAKPEISAPGAAIASSVPNTRAVLNGSSFSQANMTEVDVDGDGKLENNYYSYMQGTSMAAPYVTGTIATWLEANPNLTYDDIVEVFKKSAIRDRLYETDYMPNNKYGYGRIHSYNGLLAVLGLYTSVQDVEAPASILLYPNPTHGEFNIGFTRDDHNVVVSVYSMNGQLVYNQQVGGVTAGEDLAVSLNGVENGAYVVKVIGDAANETYRLLVTK